MDYEFMDDSQVVKEQRSSWFFQMIYDWFTFQANFLINYGWQCLGGLIIAVIIWNWLQPKIEAWKQAREDAAYHKDPDRMLAREEAVRRARERQEQRLRADSARAAELQKEKEERKRREAIELLERHGRLPGAGGRRLGSADDGFLPLSGGAGGSSYRAPKRSACGGGGCGR
ncbi:selenoprotein S B-like [Cydia splendana]|uniref:selenoprotein S B-like n=1 Tax=Cydia splendana TaxID=1100963 RepID=UPI0028F461FC